MAAKAVAAAAPQRSALDGPVSCTDPDPVIEGITTRRILYWLAAMVALLVVGTVIGLIWADTSNVAGAFAGVTNVVGVVGIVLLITRRRETSSSAPLAVTRERGVSQISPRSVVRSTSDSSARRISATPVDLP